MKYDEKGHYDMHIIDEIVYLLVHIFLSNISNLKDDP